MRLATLTNSPTAMMTAQLASTGLSGLFEVVVSWDDVRQPKPTPEPYLRAASRLGVPVAEVILVAAHGWDIAGVLSAGAQAVFVAGAGQELLPVGPHPRMSACDRVEAVDRLSEIAA